MEEEERGWGQAPSRVERAAAALLLLLLLVLFHRHQLIKSLYRYVQNCRFQWREHLLTLNQLLLVFMNGIVRSVSSIISFLYSIIAK